jgi:hypothetical protein
MWFSIIQNVIISVLIIFLSHHLVTFLQNTYTTRKTKDVVGFHVQKYKTIMNELQETNAKDKLAWMKEINEAKSAANTISSLTSKDKTDLSETDLRSMNEDLAEFIQRQMNQY